MKIIHIVGNRPQFIKLAILSGAIKRFNFPQKIIHTGQHFSSNMSDIFFQQLKIPSPDYELGVASLSHPAMIAQMILKIEAVLKKESPDFIVVYGDTNTTLAGALTAKKMNIPLVHVEAGVRTFDESMPEESNRYLTDRMAHVNFCCTKQNLSNLHKEGLGKMIESSHCYFTGDLMLDALNQYLPKALKCSLPSVVPNEQFILTTIHRASNNRDEKKLGQIIRALNNIHKEIPVVCLLHPMTGISIKKYNFATHFICLQPMGYLQTLLMIYKSDYVITDSGGLSREAFFLKKPSVIIMDKPFWPEIIENSPSVKSDATEKDILTSTRQILHSTNNQFNISVFGSGNANIKMVEILNKIKI